MEYPRVYQLSHFCVDIQLAIQEEIDYCLAKKRKGAGILSLISQYILKKQPRKIMDKRAVVFQAEFLEPRNHAYYEGYFQSEKYFLHIRERLLREFKISTPPLHNSDNRRILDLILKKNAISLHIRRGDYLTPKNTERHCLCSPSYYQNAIQYIIQRVENPHFFIFSDDISWVYDNFKISYPYTIVDVNDSYTGYYDLELMRNCKHNIIANSTFSWWGAWLNENPNKIVIAPQRWFMNQEDEIDIIPSSWVKI